MMTKEQYSQNYRQGNAIAVTHDVAAAAHYDMLVEWLGAAESVLDEALDMAMGDVGMLYEGERRLFELYATWDSFNHGHRQTSTQLIEAHGGKPPVKEVPSSDTDSDQIHEAEEEEDDDPTTDA